MAVGEYLSSGWIFNGKSVMASARASFVVKGLLTDCSAFPDTSFPSTHIEYNSPVIVFIFIQMKWRRKVEALGEAEVAAVLLPLWGHD